MTNSVRASRTPAGGATGRRRKLGTGIVLLLGLFAGLVGIAPSAFAHHAYLQDNVESVCDPESGMIRVDFEVNSWDTVSSGNRVLNAAVGVQYRLGPTATFPTPTVPVSGFSPDVFVGAFVDNNAGGVPTFSGSFLIDPSAAGQYLQLRAYPKATWWNAAGTSSTPPNADEDDSFVVAIDPLPGNCPPPNPSATATLQCAEQRVQLSFTGSGSATTVDIRKNGVIVAGGDDFPVPVGGPTIFNVPLTPADEDDPSLDIDLDYASGTDQAFDIKVDCTTPTPGAQARVRCAQGDVLVTLSNTGTQSTTADITKDGVLVGDDVVVPVGGTTFSVAVDDGDENTDVTITVDFAVGDDPAPFVLPIDCKEPMPTASALVRCAEGDVLVTLANDGDDATTADITKDGVLVGDDVVVPVGGTTFSVAVDEADENSSVTIVVDFAVGADPAPFVLPVDCKEPMPAASALVRCAEGDVLVTLANDGDDATTADITKDGVLVGDDVVVPVGGTTFSVALDDGDENTDVTITVDFAVGADPAPFVLPIDCKQPVPSATAELECAEGDLLVTLANDGDDATTADITKDGVLVADDVSVPVGGTTVRVALAPEDENTDVTITVDFAVGDDPAPVVVPVDCQRPAVGSVQFDCAEGGVVVTLFNDGLAATTVMVADQAVTVPAGAGSSDENPAIRVVVPVDEDADYDFTVTGDQVEQRVTGTANCLRPEPSVDDEVECAAGGVSVVLRNTGDDTATFTITSPAVPGGVAEETVEGGEVKRFFISLAEEASTDILVTSEGEVLFEQSVTRDCEEVQGGSVVPALPRTGTEPTGLLALAGVLLLAGFALTTAGRRKVEVLG